MTTSRPISLRAACGLASATLAVGLLTACSSPVPAGAGGPATTAVSPTPSASPGGLTFDGVTVSGPLDQEPVFLIGDSTQSSVSLQVRDVVEGTGPRASASDKVTVRYSARSAKTKRPFDSSWSRGTPFHYDPTKIAFAAFTEGVPGMKAGGRRLVIVPGPLAYGATPPASLGLGANETLVFVIDLVSID